MRGISKIEVARRQIDAAIRMLFEEADVLAVQTLAWAAYCIVSDLAKAVGCAEPPHSVVYKQVLASEHRRISNFLKHADRDSFEAIYEFPEDSPEFVLDVALALFVAIGGQVTEEMRAFELVQGVKYRRFIDSDERREAQRQEEREFERQLEDTVSDDEREEVYQRHQAKAKLERRAYLTLGRKLLNNEELFGDRKS